MQKSLFIEIADDLKARQLESVNGKPIHEFIPDAIRREFFPSNSDRILIDTFDGLKKLGGDFNLSVPENPLDAFRSIADKLSQLKSNNKNWNYVAFYFAWLWAKDRATALYILERCRANYKPLLEHQWQVAEPRTQKKTVFISWSGECAKKIALAIKGFLQPYKKSVETFLSSEDIERGPWREQLRHGLGSATEGVIIATPEIIDSHYAAFEFSLLSEKEMDPLILLFDCPRAILPPVMQSHQVIDFSESKFREWLAGLVPVSQKFPTRKFLSLVNTIRALRDDLGHKIGNPDNDRWLNNCHRPIAISAQQKSPFDLEDVLKMAKRRVVLIAQNHWHMTDYILGNHKEFWKTIKNSVNNGIRIDIVAMQEIEPRDSSTPSAIDAWGIYMNKREQFAIQTKSAWNLFREWYNEYHANLPEKSDPILNFYAAYLAPITMSFVDPESGDGLAIISPRPASRESADRPQFILRERQEKQIFNYYWRIAKDDMGNGRWLKNPFGQVSTPALSLKNDPSVVREHD